MTKSSPSRSKSGTEPAPAKHFKCRPSCEMLLLVTRYRIRKALEKHRKCIPKKVPGVPINQPLAFLHDDLLDFWEDVETLFHNRIGKFMRPGVDEDEDEEIKAYLKTEKERRQEEEEKK